MLAEEVRERARRPLLLALDEERDAEVEVAAALGERADGADVRHHAGLVVGGAAAVEPVAALRGLEGRGVPVLVAAGRLHVVVGVEQHGRASVARRAAGHHRGLAEFGTVALAHEGTRTSTTSNTPSPRRRSATASALAATCAGSKAGHETDGILTSSARSAIVDGKPASTARSERLGRRASPAAAVGSVGGSGSAGNLRATDPRTPVAKQPHQHPCARTAPRRSSTQATKAGKGAPTPSRAQQEAAASGPRAERPQGGGEAGAREAGRGP